MEDEEQVRERFLAFLENFRDEAYAEEDAAPLYIHLLDLLKQAGRWTLSVDFNHLRSYDEELAELVKVRLSVTKFKG